jgi:hypothetical protein
MNKRMHRRMFLRGLGGAVVAAPYLSSVWERMARGQTAPAKPKQLIVMFTHYGCVTTKFFPTKSHGALASTDIVNSMAPLAPYVSKLLIPRGIRAMNEWTASNNGTGGRGQGNDPHLNVVGSYFTLQPVTPNTNNPIDFSTATKFNAKPVGSSLDHVLAQQLSATGTPMFMRVGNSGGSAGEGAQSNISYLKSATAAAGDAAAVYPGLGTPMQAFSALTGLFGTGSTMNPDTYASTRGKRVSDLVKHDLENLKRLDMSAEDKNKCNAWEALLNDMGTVITTGAMCNMNLATQLGATTANVQAASTGGVGSDLLTKMITSSLDGADMYSVMAVLAAACNYNPVIFLKYPPNYVFSGLQIPEEAHALSHRLDNANMTGTCYPNALTLLRKIDTYYSQKFANLVGMLDGIKNSDGSTLLDSTATVWFQEMSDGNAHNLNNLPIVQAGSMGGYFKTGWAVNVDTSNTGAANMTGGNSESQCADGSTSGQVNGINQSTGTPAMTANGPINKYFYALMNGLGRTASGGFGIKVNAMGFPDKNGTPGEVKAFGYSDLTTDFNGGLGAVKGATIHSPGEYTALKA